MVHAHEAPAQHRVVLLPIPARALLGDGSTLDTRRSGHDHRPVAGGLQTFVISHTVLKMAILLWEF